MTTGSRSFGNVLAPPAAPDESWLERASPILVHTEGDIAHFRLSDPQTRAQGLALRTSWAADEASKRLEHEFSLKSRLDPSWAIVPDGLIRTADGPVLLYRDRIAPPLVVAALAPLSITRFLHIASEAARALAKLHERRLLHCDIKPAALTLGAGNHIRLTSFGLCRALDKTDRSRATDRIVHPSAYTPPEQSHLGGDHLDERSDLYALGITLFECLTGALPLKAASAAEWLHAHIAIQPAAPSLLRADVPAMLDSLILKLLAKDPADRFQSAATLAADLDRCADDWSAYQAIRPFELGRIDRLARLPHATALFGRDAEFRLLSESYDRVARTGNSEILLLTGPAGSGKTVLTQQLGRTASVKSSLFASGKVDQYQAAAPYAPVIQALRGLVMGVLGGHQADLQAKRAAFHDQLDGHTHIVAHLIPEFDLLTGSAATTQGQSGGQAPARVHRTLVKALQVFAARGTPLVLFLDDLQWADDATLELVSLIADTAPKNLLLVGAYRDHGASQSSRFKAFLRDQINSATPVIEIALSPITTADVGRLIATTLGEQDQHVESLARAIHGKTAGNPFYANQLLHTLVDERVIHFDAKSQSWTWDIEAIERQRQTDNIVDLLISRLERLSPGTRDCLRLLACIGVRSDEPLLGHMAALPVEEVRRRLDPAMKTGLIVLSDTGWMFSHDRVQEAAYALTDLEDRPAQHAKIAAAMIEVWQERGQDSAFQIAGQIELSVGAPMDRARADLFADALYTAAERAVAAAARGEALTYLAVANDILGPERWTENYRRARAVAVLRVQCLLAVADLDGAEAELEPLFERMETAIDQAEPHRLKAALLTVRSDFRGAARVALSGLRLLGIDLPFKPTSAQLTEAYEAVRQGLNGREIAELVDLPVMTDPVIEATMSLLTALEATFFYPHDGLMLLHLAVMTRLTLTHGVTSSSVQGLAWLGVSIAHTYDAADEGFAFAKVALALVDRHGYERYRTATLLALDQVSVWTQPLSYALDRAREAKAAGNFSAELRWLCYSCNHIISDLLVMGEDMTVIQEEADALLAVARKAGYDDIVDLVSTQMDFMQTLQRGPDHRVGAWESAFAEIGDAAEIVRQPMTALLCWTYTLRGEAAFLYGDLATASISLAQAADLAWSIPAHINISDIHLYAALTAAYGARTEEDRASAVGTIEGHRARFVTWAARNPRTFRNKLALLDAELARLQGDDLTAMRHYEKAASAAAAENFVHEQALAHELAGRHAEEVGLAGLARHHLRLAYASYRRWGASGKVRRLEEENLFLAAETQFGPQGAAPLGQEDLDFAVGMRTAQALSEEIVLDKLIETLMTSMIVHAGAQNGLLLIMRDGEPRIEATGRVTQGKVVVEIGGSEPTDVQIPMSVLFTVLRTRKRVSFADAASQELHQHAASLALHPARSLLCLPLLKQGALVGVLYLENNLAPDVFTPKKTAMLEVLAPQAANALETARLYAEVIEQNTRRQETEAALRSARADLARTSHLTVMGQLAASIAHEINQPLSGIVSSVGASLRWIQGEQPNIPEVLSNLHDIRNAGLRAAEIVRALRSLAKQAPAQLEHVAIDDLIRNILTLTAAEIDARNVRLFSRLDAHAPLLADPTQLQQVLLNLVTNALDAMESCDRVRELAVSSSVWDGSVIVRIGDSGPGIPEDIVERIFDPFFTTKTSGMGMGLAICRSIMEAHGGTLEATSTPKGSNFTFKLPIATAS